jgi:hypothetical protein
VSSCCWGAVTTQQDEGNSIASTRLIRTGHFGHRLSGEGAGQEVCNKQVRRAGINLAYSRYQTNHVQQDSLLTLTVR